MALDELYREVILDHYRNPRNRKPLDASDSHADGHNPLCGDEISLDLHFEGETVAEVAIIGRGCSISQSSASMMSEAIKGKTRAEIDEGLDPERPGAVLGDLEALQGVRKFPVRIKCANLAWTTLDTALNQ
jgi:nitrogen fixation NifU-like protein